MRSRTLSLLLAMFLAAPAFAQQPAQPTEPPAPEAAPDAPTETEAAESEGFGSMAKSNLRMGQVIGNGVVIGGDQLSSGERRSGKSRDAEIRIDG